MVVSKLVSCVRKPKIRGYKMTNFTQKVGQVIQHFNPIFANPIPRLKVDTKYEEY